MTPEDLAFAAHAKRASKVAHDLRQELDCDAIVILCVSKDGQQFMGTCHIDPLGMLKLFSATTSAIIRQVEGITLPVLDLRPPQKLDA